MNQPTRILTLALLLLQLMDSIDAKMSIISTKLDFKVGDEILLLCKAGAEGDITWQKDGEDIDDEEIVNKLDEASSKLVIKKATMQDAGRYTCHCDFDSGHKDDAQIQLFVYDGPSFGSTKTYHEFLEGTDGLVPCLVTGQPQVDVQWFKNQQEISNVGGHMRKQSDNTLRIEKVKREDAGTYVCRAQIRGRPSIFMELSVSVVVNAPPTVRLREEVKKVLAGPETNVSLLCLVDGLPQPNITWTMPVQFNPSRHHFNSDSSQLTIQSVVREDFGEYVCTATNKIAESSATIMLHVFEAPEVFVSAEQQRVLVGEAVSVSCNVTGHPHPELHWLNKQNGQTLSSTSGRVRVVDNVLMIDEVVPSDGGLYSCMAISSSGNASRDVAVYTQPGPPLYLSVSAGPASVHFSLKTTPVSGGTPITSFVLQWKEKPTEQWKENTVPATDPLVINLKPYTSYTVRLSALNAVGRGKFSETHNVHTQGIQGEPDSPVLSSDEMKIESNTFSVPLKHTVDGGSPVLQFNVRYRQDKEEAEWKELQMPPDADSVSLKDLAFGSNYQLEVSAVNANGSSIPATFNFTIAEQSAKSGMTKGAVVGIVMIIFLVVFIAVDATCCYRNHCGLLMCIAVKLFGQKVPGIKKLEEGGEKGEVKLKGMSTLKSSMQQVGVPLKEGKCDKAPLTKNEKTQPDRDLPSINA
nr:neural cell adhesion molecule 1 [Maylandia zebra]